MKLIQGRFGYANNRDMLELLGVTRLPVNGMSPRRIQGILVWVIQQRDKEPNERKRHTHRIYTQCPTCQRAMSVGRMHQHKCSVI